MIYVCPRFDKMPPAMLAHCRLYAFPNEPDPPPAGGFDILDSGAFGLSQRGRAMGREHMESLAEYYRPFAGQPGYHCIAPDVYLDPDRTMRNWRWWQENVALPVVPVIQLRKARRVDLFAVQQQARFYAPWRPAFVAISNPGLRAGQSRDMVHACRIVREETACAWLHNLGAGWDPRDIAAWRDEAGFDSIDSIAYYTDARDGWLWLRGGGRVPATGPWRETAVANALAATQIAGLTGFGGGREA